MSRHPLDSFEHLLVLVETEQQWIDDFSRTTSLKEVVILAQRMGIVISEEELRGMIGGQDGHIWICGGKDFNPIKHLKKLVLAT